MDTGRNGKRLKKTLLQLHVLQAWLQPQKTGSSTYHFLETPWLSGLASFSNFPTITPTFCGIQKHDVLGAGIVEGRGEELPISRSCHGCAATDRRSIVARISLLRWPLCGGSFTGAAVGAGPLVVVITLQASRGQSRARSGHTSAGVLCRVFSLGRKEETEKSKASSYRKQQL
jgi:hypothetical protein